MKIKNLTRVIFIVISFLSEVYPQKVFIIAHRGASAIAPENTLAAIKLGYELGADMVEIDVYKTKDNKIVVIHDSSTLRTSGVDLEVTETTSDELRKLDVGELKGEEYKGEKIPFLEEVLGLVPTNKKLMIEIKDKNPEIIPLLKDVIQKSGKSEQIEIVSFNYVILEKVKVSMPDIPVYLLYSTDSKSKEYDDSLIQITKDMNFQGLSLSYNGLTKKFVKKAKKAGLKVFVWTVDDLNKAKELKEYKVDGIITNIPDKVIKELE